MKFSSVASALAFYVLAREGSVRTTRLQPFIGSSRRPASSPGNSLLTVTEIGAALTCLAEVEATVLLLHHGDDDSVDRVRDRLSRITRKRYSMRTVRDILVDAEIALDRELRRRELLGNQIEE